MSRQMESKRTVGSNHTCDIIHHTLSMFRYGEGSTVEKGSLGMINDQMIKMDPPD